MIYSGVFKTRKQAKKDLRELKADFPGAKIVQVSASGGGLASEGDKDALSGKKKEATVGKDQLKELKDLSPKEYQKKAKKLPDTTKLPGKAPPKDDKKPGGGGRRRRDRMSVLDRCSNRRRRPPRRLGRLPQPEADDLILGGGAAVRPRDLAAQRDRLAERLAELQWDLGGLAYEMAIRDHFRLDVLVRAAAELQRVDAELGEVERLLLMERSGAAGECPSCGALHGRGAVYCWQCGTPLLESRRLRRLRAG